MGEISAFFSDHSNFVDEIINEIIDVACDAVCVDGSSEETTITTGKYIFNFGFTLFTSEVIQFVNPNVFKERGIRYFIEQKGTKIYVEQITDPQKRTSLPSVTMIV